MLEHVVLSTDGILYRSRITDINVVSAVSSIGNLCVANALSAVEIVSRAVCLCRCTVPTVPLQ